jgi:20S proteasome alpha/beta subunit
MKYQAKAIGSGSDAAQSELQDKYHSVWSAPFFDPRSHMFLANELNRSSKANIEYSQASDGGEVGSA